MFFLCCLDGSKNIPLWFVAVAVTLTAFAASRAGCVCNKSAQAMMPHSHFAKLRAKKLKGMNSTTVEAKLSLLDGYFLAGNVFKSCNDGVSWAKNSIFGGF